MTTDPTGRRFVLRRDDVTAEVSQVGAALRALTVGGVDVVPRYADDIPTPAASGVVLVPWPNRIRDGVWNDAGTSRQLAITEPALGNASHGLLRFTAYVPDAEPGEALTLRADVYPQTGYPYHLETAVTFSLTDSGLHIRHDVRNIGSGSAPVALGVHPYLQIGGVDTADLQLRSSGRTRLVLDERKLPVSEEPVDEITDMREGRRVGDLSLDTAYRGLERDEDGRVRHTLTAPDGRTLTLWQGAGFDWVQIFTTDRYPGHPLAIAVEPMTAPPEAFNSGIGVRRIESGDSLSREWGIDFSR